MKLLVVEDDRDMRDLVRVVLREEGHTVDEAATLSEGGLLARTGEYDGIVLDVRLPDGNGLTLASQLRRERVETPILMLSAQTATPELARGLDAGADDYLRKPFEVLELKARVRALVRRRGAARRDDQLTVGHLFVNRLTRQAAVRGVPLELTSKQFALLEYLALHPDEVVTRSQLLERVWERSRDPESNVIDVHVARLRAKLQPAGGEPQICTRRGVGFVLATGLRG